jgi:ubiquinone/menaquinone biosynthesis C-methylase UbiE
MSTNNPASESICYSGSVPQHYDKYQGPVFFEPYAVEIARRIDPSSVRVALELACGTGQVTRHLRNAISSDSRLIASDLSPDMLVIAKEKLKELPIDWQVIDAQDLPFADNSIDLITCSFGYMFVPDKPKGFKEAFRVLRPGGILLFSTWDQLELNGASYVHRKVVKKYLGDPLPESYLLAFSMNNDLEIKQMLQVAGFAEVTVERVDKLAISPTAKETAEGLAQGGSIHDEIIKRNPQWVAQIQSEIEKELAEKFGEAPMEAPMRAVFTTAKK